MQVRSACQNILAQRRRAAEKGDSGTRWRAGRITAISIREVVALGGLIKIFLISNN